MVEQIKKASRRQVLAGSVAALTLATGISGKGNVEAQEIGFDENKFEKSRPFPGKRVNFSPELCDAFFPDQINLKLKRRTFVTSRKWQIGCWYDENGKKILVKGAPSYSQVGTGELLPKRITKLGLYTIREKNPLGGEYKSHGTSEGEGVGAPMPWAVFLGENTIGRGGKIKTENYTGTAVHGRPSSISKGSLLPFRSHGCFGLEEENSKIFFDFVNADPNSGDYVLCIDDPDILYKTFDAKQIIVELEKEEKSGRFIRDMEAFMALQGKQLPKNREEAREAERRRLLGNFGSTK